MPKNELVSLLNCMAENISSDACDIDLGIYGDLSRLRSFDIRRDASRFLSLLP